MEKTLKKPKVIIAMSGGVDSSVAAVLLKKQGFDVTGVFMHFWSEEPARFAKIRQPAARRAEHAASHSARLAAKKLGIRFYTLNVVKEFKKAVVDYFLKELKKGVTPNPCVVCNKEIKFKVLLKKAEQMGADFVATGHYARLWRETKNQKPKTKTYECHLLKAKDKNKDQSYFLYTINQSQLARYLFPIGDYLKSEVRKMAKKMKLAAWDRPESQEICFIYDNDMKRFIKKHMDLTPGKIIDTRGKIIGVHDGLPLFTIGQRHGLGIGGGKPYYVVGTDYKTHKLIVTSDPKDKLLWRKKLLVCDVNWISGNKPLKPFKCQATIRYRHKPEKAIVSPHTKRFGKGVKRKKGKGNDYEVIFSRPQRAITPGQSVIFYRGNEVLGGGIIGCGQGSESLAAFGNLSANSG
ncbi:tRNA 2-thiouridine(34) synthase MnmA [Patescibacteria group bacterium]|nr:tRNA 2-thiouridine(34) synthase MnmA [Patescibacteria group bacterium]MBU3999601.1 tRNA 2-thiouridine(34) synthase MnmA [Patescibacteria group bacterium]MBU4056341.1 tRNA 2-thiouridine(34) synthase MnmA [Patescibacteria group bacterium]MBU4368965.1 tRNA 2-thiouridine(34) synthase MnmA [Patescibacteria group bacterium]